MAWVAVPSPGRWPHVAALPSHAPGCLAGHQRTDLLERDVIEVALDGVLEAACGHGELQRRLVALRGLRGERVQQAGTKGVAEYMAATGVTLITGTRKEVFKDPPAQEPLFVQFLDHIYNGKAEPIPWKEIYRGHQVALGARDAMEKGRIVKL